MNPLLWKREHQVALIGAAGLGAVVAFVIAIFRVSPYGHYGYHNWAGTFIDLYWLVILLWTIFGGAIAGGIVYVQRLLRA